ncbi:MAG: hypothetical protein HYZ37_18900 [Candidatus Solibacter usitatus]|nr:hypothetical protein [Candidatus Solibacter usitatus]
MRKHEAVTIALGMAAVLSPMLRAQELKAVWNGTELRAAASKLNFISGRGWEQLRSGRTASYVIQLSVHGEGMASLRAAERFVISYDLWEERFRVTRIARGASRRLSQSNLLQPAAEAWCVENTVLSTGTLAAERTVTVQLDIRAEEPADPALSVNTGLSLTSLIELFSRPARSQQQHWTLRSNAMRLSEARARPN